MPKKEKKTEIMPSLLRLESHPIFVHKWTIGQKAADNITKLVGSWTFILSFLIFLAVWITLNIYIWINHWDPYPFYFLNLVLACLTAIQVPIILMSQNREAQKERIKAEYDHSINRKSEKGIEEIKKQLDKLERHLSR